MARLPKPRPPRGEKRLRSGGLEVLAMMGIPTGTRAGRPTYSHHRRKWQTLSPPHHAPVAEPRRVSHGNGTSTSGHLSALGTTHLNELSTRENRNINV